MGNHTSALDGPDDQPTRQNYVEFSGCGYVDSVLTEHQLDIVCGVYRIKPGERSFFQV